MSSCSESESFSESGPTQSSRGKFGVGEREMLGVDGRVTAGVVGVDVMTMGEDEMCEPADANGICIFESMVGCVPYSVHALVNVHN